MCPILASLPYVVADNGRLHLCEAAGLAYQPNPQPYPYAENYWANYQALKGSHTSGMLDWVRWETVEMYAGDKPILDIGIGNGEFIEEGIRRQHRILGYDVNPLAQDWLRQKKILRNPYLLPEHQRDPWVITLWDTLEHIHDPQALFACLPAQSIVCASLPVFNRIDESLLQSKHYKPDEHVMYVSVGGFIWWMQRHGFTPLDFHYAETRAGRENIGTFVFRKR